MHDKDWEKAFKMIDLENTLANHRLTGLLTVQGFLFAATTFSLNGLAKVEGNQPAIIFSLLALVFVACLIGASSPWLVRPGLVSAYRQIAISAHWLEVRRNNKDVGNYPPIVGIPMDEFYLIDEKKEIDKKRIDKLTVGILRLPLLLSVAWVLLAMFVSIFNFRYAMCIWHLLF